VILSCLKLIRPAPWHARDERVSTISPNSCRCERDDNKISRQHICVTALRCSTMKCTISSAICIILIDGLLCLEFGFIKCGQSQRESMPTLVVIALFYLLLVVVHISIVIVYEICLKLKYGFRITHKFSTFELKTHKSF
jgi:hypothetical protein